MTRPRGASATSEESGAPAMNQELGSMYDYLAKIILLGPSGTGKSCLLHRFVKNEWRVLSSQTIGVEFATKIIKVGTGARRKRIKLQLWDTAGTERFRSVSRSYYRGAAGAVLVYDMTSHSSFRSLQPFLNDARALASPNLSLILVGNKADLAQPPPAPLIDVAHSSFTPSSYASSSAWTSSDSTHTDDDAASTASQETITGNNAASTAASLSAGPSTHGHATIAPEGREVFAAEANRWAAAAKIPVVVETSALNGDGVEEVFARLARMILTKIELGDIDPDDPNSGIQYGDAAFMLGGSDGASVRSGITVDDGGVGGSGVAGAGSARKRKARGGARGGRRGDWGGLRDWEEVFTLNSRRRGRCCG